MLYEQVTAFTITKKEEPFCVQDIRGCILSKKISNEQMTVP
jgi:hypothetical protein